MLITQEEVRDYVFTRNVSPQLISAGDIADAEEYWFRYWVGDAFYDAVIGAPTDYTDFLNEGVKPCISTGLLYTNFDRIITQITDKGYIQMLTEGGAQLVGDDLRGDTKRAIYYKLMRLIGRMQDYAEAQKESGDPLYADFEKMGNTHIIRIGGRSRRTTIIY